MIKQDDDLVSDENSDESVHDKDYNDDDKQHQCKCSGVTRSWNPTFCHDKDSEVLKVFKKSICIK